MKKFNALVSGAQRNVTGPLMKLVRNPGTAVKVGIAGALASPAMCFAEDYSALITGAGDDANANQKLVIGAVIALAVIGFGAAAIVAWMKK